MANTTTTVSTSVGTTTVDQSVIPYMRARAVEFAGQNLRPGRQAQFFFGDTNVTRFVQRASQLVPDTANANTALTAVVQSEERYYCNSTHCFVTAIGASNGTIYLNENYICVNVSQVGANTGHAADFSVGDIVYQLYGANNTVQSPAFEGVVAYWNSSDSILAIEPLAGELNANATSTSNTAGWIWHSGFNNIVSANNFVLGTRFPLNAFVTSLDNVANKFLVQTYKSYHGLIPSQTAPNANCVILAATPPSDLLGNVVFITSGQGLGQAGLAVSNTANIAVLNVALSPQAQSNSGYSLGLATVDATGHIYGVFQLPETTTVNFLTGSHKFTISDSPIVDDPNASMLATGNYVSQGYLGSGTSTPSTPIVQPAPAAPPAQAPVTGIPATSIGSVANPTVVLASPGPNTTYAGVVSQVNANSAANGLYNGVSIQWPWALFDVDPVAQTFFTPPPKSSQTNYGIFLSSIDVWFQAKPIAPSPLFPVQLFIAETNNGVPTSNVIASCSVAWEQIVVAGTPDSANVGSLISQNQNVTKFKFADPVYLQASTEYAIILYSESPDYEVWIGSIGSLDTSSAGNGVRRISAQPSVGSFFKSQNAGAWTPVQNEMLMFVINKAVFSTGAPVSFTFNMIPYQGPAGIWPYDDITLGSSDMNFSQSSLTYKLQSVLANTGAPDPTFFQVTPGVLFDFGQDLKTSSLQGTRRRILLQGNNASLLTQVTIQTQDPDVSPVFNAERLFALTTTNIVNAGPINPENISITSAGNHINAANIVVTFSAPDILSGNLQATGNVTSLSGNSVTAINMITPGAGYSVAPTITISEAGAPANATAVVSGENAVSGGNGVARYITRQIALAQGMAAGDLRVYLSAIMPVGTNISCYYKVLSSTDTNTFAQTPWVEMTPVNQVNSPDQITPVALQFCPTLGPNGLPSGLLAYTYNGVQYPLGGTFQFFAIKIVLFADDPTVSPVVQSFQAIALPSG